MFKSASAPKRAEVRPSHPADALRKHLRVTGLDDPYQILPAQLCALFLKDAAARPAPRYRGAAPISKGADVRRHLTTTETVEANQSGSPGVVVRPWVPGRLRDQLRGAAIGLDSVPGCEQRVDVVVLQAKEDAVVTPDVCVPTPSATSG